jgi:hypothetical protein
MVEADITWSLSGVDTRRWNVQAGSLWRPPVGVRLTQIDIPGRHGTVATGLPVFDAPQINLELLCKAATQAALEAASVELVGLLAAPGLLLGRSSGGTVTDASARFMSMSPGQFFPDASARFSVILDAPGVFFRSTSVDSTPEIVVSPEVVSLPGLAVGNAPVSDAVLRIRGAGTSVSVVDGVSGTGISWSGTALTGSDYLYLHADTLTARRSTSSMDWASGGTDVSGGVSYPAAGPLQLWPRMAALDPAARAVTVTVTGSGFDATTALTVRARPAYL